MLISVTIDYVRSASDDVCDHASSRLAREILEFYLCAEQKALRDLASREPENAMVMRARTMYWDSEAAPKEPFMDRWSAAEFGRRDWLFKMTEAFG